MSVKLGDLWVGIKGDDAQLARDLQKAQQAAAKAGKAMADDMKRVGEEMRNVGGTLSAAITAPLAALGIASVNEARKLESLTSGLEFVIGSASGARKQMEELQSMSDRTAQSFGALAQASLGLTSGFSGNVEEANFVLEQFSALSGKLGVTSQDFDRMVTNMIQVGGSARLAGDELREMSAILPGFRDLLTQAFGTASSEELAKMGLTGREVFLGLADVIEKSGVKVDLDNLNTLINSTRNEFTKLSLELGPVILPPLKDAAKAVRELLGEFRGLTPEAQKMIIAGGVAAAALGPMLVVAGSTAQVLGTLPGLIAGIGKAGPLLGPLGIAVGVAAAGVVAYQQDWGDLKKVIDGAVGDIGKSLQDMQAAWDDFYAENKKTLDEFSDSIAWAFGTGLGYAVDHVKANLERTIGLFTWMGKNVGIVYKNMSVAGAAFGTYIATIRQRVEVAWRAMVGTILDGAAAAVDGIAQLSRLTPLGIFSEHIGGAADSLRAQADRYRREGSRAAGIIADADSALRSQIFDIVFPERLPAPPGPKFGPVYRPGDVTQTGDDTRDGRGGGNQGGGGNRGNGATGRADGLLDLMAADPNDTYTVFTPPTSLTNQIDLAKLNEIRQRFHTDMARLSDPRTAIADWAGMGLGEFKRLIPTVQEQIKAMHQEFMEATEGAALFKTFLEGSTAASVQLGESMTKWMGEQDAAMAARAKVQREWLLGIEKQILLSADASELVKLQYDRENGLGEAAQLTNEEYEERVEALRRLQEHNAELDKSRRFEEALANMVKIRADEQEKAMQAVEAQRSRYLDRLGDMAERLRTLSGITGEAELKARLLGEGLSQSQADALVSIDMVISRMEEQRAEMQRVAEAGAEALKAGFDKLFDGQGVGGFWNGMIESFRGALNQMLAEALAARFRDSLQDLFKINPQQVQDAQDKVNRAGIPDNTFQIVRGLMDFSSGMFKGFRAEGGPVVAGAGYIVGERGPEYFVPSSNGRVYNERQLAGAGGPQVVVNITIQASDPRQFEASAGQIQAQIGRTVERALRRNSGR